MSGGHFDYNQYRINEIADEIDRLIEQNHSASYSYPPEIIDRFKEASYGLRRAFEMAQRVDWLESGDDGPESFMQRWDEEVRPPWGSINPASSNAPEAPSHRC